MSHPALDALAEAYQGLIRALDTNDIGAIEAATASTAGAVERVRAERDWRELPAVQARLLTLSALLQTAQGRVNFLTDHVRRRIDGLAAARGHCHAVTYRPAGR